MRVCIRSLCRNSKEGCESVLGIVGLQWPEDTDCAQFPEEGQANSSCLLPDPDVNGQCAVKLVFTFEQAILYLVTGEVFRSSLSMCQMSFVFNLTIFV